MGYGFRIIMLSLLALMLVASASAISELWVKNLGSNVTLVETDEYGSKFFAVTANNTIWCYNQGGSLLWTKAAGSTVNKIVSSADGSILVYSTANVIHMVNANTGVTFNSWSNAARAGGIVDFSMTTNGSLVVFIAKQYITALTSSNATLADRYTAADGTMEWEKTYIEPSGLYVLVSNNTKVYKYTFVENIGTWYGNYRYRKQVTVTGSTSGYLERWNGTYFLIYNTTGVTSGNTLYIGKTCRNDFTDIRFTFTNNTLMQHVVNGYGPNYVNISPVFHYLAASAPVSLYIYWGDPNITSSGSNLTNTFGEDIGYINPPNWNWNLETTDNWTWAYTLGHSYAGGDGTTSSTWKTQGSYSLRSYTYAHYPDGWGSGTFTSTGLPGLNGSFGYYNGLLDLHWVIVWEATARAASAGYTMSHSTLGTLKTYTKSHQGWLTETIDDLNVSLGVMPAGSTFTLYQHTGGGETVHSYVYLDNIRLKRRVSPMPTVGSWKTTQSILDLQYQANVSVTGLISQMDMAGGDWLAIGSSNNVTHVPVTSTGFGTSVNAASSGTLFELKTAGYASSTIEGRGILTNIYKQDITKDRTYTHGGWVYSVDMAKTNGLWSVSGSQDGKVYIFSKDQDSSWYLEWSSDSGDPVYAVAITHRGEYVVGGRRDGTFTVYASSIAATTTAPPAPFYQEIYVYRDGERSPGDDVVIYRSSTTVEPFSWTEVSTMTTDSYGRVLFQAYSGTYYRAVVNGGEKEYIWAATSANTYIVIDINSVSVHSQYTHYAKYNNATRNIEMYYDDAVSTISINFKVYDSITHTEVFNTTTYGDSTFDQQYHDATNSSYKVTMHVVRGSGFIVRDTWYLSGPEQWHMGLDVDQHVLNAIFVLMFMTLGGLFSYAQSFRGALFLTLIALAVCAWGVVTIPLEYVCLIGAVAILSVLARGSQWR